MAPPGWYGNMFASICFSWKPHTRIQTLKHTGGGKLFRALTNPMQNLLWLVKIYHPYLAQFRDNTNFIISDLQNNTKAPNLTNNWHLSKFWVLHSILDVSKLENKKDKFEGQQNLDPQLPIKILLSLKFILFVLHLETPKIECKTQNFDRCQLFVKLGALVLFCKSLIMKFVLTLNCAKYRC